VFVVYAIPIGLAAGLLLGGRLEGLASLGFRWAPLAIAGLLVQIAIFGPLGELVGTAGPALYVGSTVAVLAAVVRNVRIPGLALVVIGASLNLAAIIANGGVMPADPGALAVAGLVSDRGFSNSAVLEAPVLRPLTDIYALPTVVPFANVFSVGDVLIGIGIASTIALGMRRAPHVRTRRTTYD
jgi:fermentation-respiration switch protein FrsA (DUF1100 family)